MTKESLFHLCLSTKSSFSTTRGPHGGRGTTLRGTVSPQVVYHHHCGSGGRRPT